MTDLNLRTSAVWPALAVAALVLASLAGLPALGTAQTSESGADDLPAALVAYRIAGNAEVRLDGDLEEEIWALSTPITDFTQQEPVEGAQPSERTEVRVAYDEEHLKAE